MKTFFGVVCVLLAIFCGGCGTVFFASGVDTLMKGQVDYGITVMSVIIGIVPGIIFGVLAWVLLRKPRDQGAETDS